MHVEDPYEERYMKARFLIQNSILVLFLACLISDSVYGQPTAFPSKPVRILVPYPAGGAVDIIARAIGPKLTTSTGQPTVVENRPGASGIIASENLVKSSADGHTLIIVISSHAVNPSMYKKLPYDTLSDFSAVTMIGSGPNILSVHPSLPVRTVRQLITLAKSHRDSINYATFGNGSSSHLSGELFNIMAGVKMTAVTYKGAAPAVIDVIGGHVPLMFGNVPVSLPHVNSKRIRAVAVTSGKRSSTLPNLPTVDESGLPGYDIGEWWGVLVHGKTPKDLVVRWNQEITKALRDPEVQSRLTQLGADLVGNTPAEFDAFIRAQMKKWGEVIKQAGIEQG
jgi:tripartite-type tricarboxylate transporter receptor subunit TctC